MKKKRNSDRKRRQKHRQTENQNPSIPNPETSSGLSTVIEALEPRIMLSATWVDADTGDPIDGPTEGDDIFTGSGNTDDIADALGGDDQLFGDMGNDQLFGGDGNDQLHGGKHSDILDGGDGDDQLYGDDHADTLISGAGNDYMDGGKHDDTFRFTGAENGDVKTVVGGHGNNTIDLSEYYNEQITDDGSTITVDMGGGESFTINYSDVDTITTAGPAPANDAPDAINDTVATAEDTAVTTENVLANDTDLDGDTLSVDFFSQPSHGSVAYNNDGTFTYTPNAEYSGSDSFTYTVTDGNGGSDTATVNVTVSPANDAPDAINDTVATAEDTAVTTENVLANDTDLDGDTLSVDSFSQPSHGSVAYNNDGTFTYTPDAEFSGSDSFTYTVTDGNGGTDTATVNVRVEASTEISQPEPEPVPVPEPAPEPEDEPTNETTNEPIKDRDSRNDDTNEQEPDEQEDLKILNPTDNYNGIIMGNEEGTSSSDTHPSDQVVPNDYRPLNTPSDDMYETFDISLEYRDDLIKDKPLPPEIAQTGFDNVYEEIDLGAEFSYSSDNSSLALPSDPSAEDPHAAEEEGQLQSVGSRFVAGLWGLLRNAAGVINRVDENPPNSSSSY